MRKRGVDRLQPDHGRPVVGGQLRLRRGRGAPPAAGADLGAPPGRRQRLRPARREPHHRRRPERDAGGAVEDGGVVPLPPEDANYSPEAAGARNDLKPIEIASPRARASSSAATSSPGRSGGCASASRRARGWCSTPSATRTRAASARSSTAPRSPTWWCPTATRGRPTSTGTPSTSASTASACWPTRWSSAATASGEIRYFDAVLNDSRGGAVTIPNADLHPRGGRRHPLEAHRPASGHTRGAPLAPAGRVVHRDGRQLRVRLLLVLLPGRHHPVRGQADRHHLERRGAGRREAAVGRAGRAAGLRADPPALLQRAAGHDGRRPRQLRLRGQHGRRSARSGQPARQRLPRGGDAAGVRAPGRSASSIRCTGASGRS